MIRRGSLVVFDGPLEYFERGWVWAQRSFITRLGESIEFKIRLETVYLVIEANPGVIEMCDWYRLMEPQGRMGWYLDVNSTAKDAPKSWVRMIPIKKTQ